MVSYCYRHFQVGPQQGSSCPVSLEPVERGRVRFRSEGKLYSLIKAWRGASSRSRAHTPGAGCGRGRFTGISPPGRGVELSGGLAQLHCSPPDCSACASSLRTARRPRRRHLELQCRAAELRPAARELRCPSGHFALGVLV